MKKGPYVIVNDRRYPTVIDDRGVQRFVENKVVNYLRKKAAEGKKCDMNDLCLTAQFNGEFSDRDYMEFYMMIGYSIGGFEEVFESAKVEDDCEIPPDDTNPYKDEEWYELMNIVEQGKITVSEWETFKKLIFRMRKRLHSVECDMAEILRIAKEYEEDEEDW